MEATPAAIETAPAATPAVVRLPPAQAVIGGITLARWRQLVIAACIVLALVLPFAVKSFFVFQLTLAIVYALAILGLNLLTGFNGQFSLGHSAFYAIGAYTAAIMMDQADVAYYWTLPVAGLVCLVVWFQIGLPALRLQGVYPSLATFPLAFSH